MLIEAVDQIVERLRTTCATAGEATFTAGDLAGVIEKDQIAPARHVILYDYEPDDLVNGDGVWNEIYLVVHVVKNVSRKERIAAQQNDAAALIAETLKALAGWKPASSTKLLQSIKGPRPSYSAAHAYFTLAFVGRPITEGAGED